MAERNRIDIPVEPPLRRDMERIAHANDRTLAAEARIALRRHVQHNADSIGPSGTPPVQGRDLGS